jgi:hypothetical protein
MRLLLRRLSLSRICHQQNVRDVTKSRRFSTGKVMISLIIAPFANNIADDLILDQAWAAYSFSDSQRLC